MAGNETLKPEGRTLLDPSAYAVRSQYRLGLHCIVLASLTIGAYAGGMMVAMQMSSSFAEPAMILAIVQHCEGQCACNSWKNPC